MRPGSKRRPGGGAPRERVTTGGLAVECIVGEPRTRFKRRLLRASEVSWLLGVHPSALIVLQRSAGLPAFLDVDGEPVWIEDQVLRWREVWEDSMQSDGSRRSGSRGGAA